MSDINPSALGESFDADFEAKVAACNTAAEISELMKNRSVSMGLVKRDLYSPDVLIPVSGPVPQKVGKVVRLNGVAHSLVADTEADLLAQENALMHQIFESPNAATEAARDERGRFTVDDPTARIESDLVTRALEAQGISPEALREFSNKKVEQSWQQATEEFLRSPEGADWLGGNNLQIAATLIEENGLIDKPSVQTLIDVWNHMKENGLTVDNPEVTARQKISEATSVEQIREALGRSSTSLFGR